jgi:glyoxylase-like metal-dependent hydrolase (beta-lactamase superfamily II)
MTAAVDKPVPADWYTVKPLADGVSLIRERHAQAWMRCNIWHIQGRDRDLLIDSGMGLRPLKTEVVALRERPVTLVSSHAHFDHIGGAWEFDDRRGHRLEAAIHEHPHNDATCASAWIGAELLTKLPHAGYDLKAFSIRPAPLTGYLDEGDRLDLGDRSFMVFHLPGHSPGSIALYEEKTRTLFSGDVIYDGALIDNAWHSNADDYRVSLERLRALPVEVVHAGHDHSFGRDRLLELIDLYLKGENRLDDLAGWLREQR